MCPSFGGESLPPFSTVALLEAPVSWFGRAAVYFLYYETDNFAGTANCV